LSFKIAAMDHKWAANPVAAAAAAAAAATCMQTFQLNRTRL
jgi:hypothetical protein